MLGGVAVVGRADPHAERRGGDGAQGNEADQGIANRVRADMVSPTARERRLRRLGHVLLPVDRELVDLRSGQPEQPGQERDGSQHRDGDHQRDGDSHRRERRQSGEEQSEDGDDHRRAREQNRLPGGGDGGAGRILDAHPIVHLLAVARDDEEGVVDAHTETDHHAQDQREVGNVHEGRQHADTCSADEEAHERGEDRQAHGDNGAERDQQHDDRDADADELAAGIVLGELSHRTGELGLNAAGTGAVCRRLRVGELRHGELVERVRHVDVRRLPVGAERRGLRGEGIGDGGDVVAGRQLLTGAVDGRFVLAVVESPVLDVEDNARRLAGLARESVRQDVGRPLRLDAGNTEAVVELAAGRAFQRQDGDCSHEPEADHPERVAGAAAAKTEEKCTHEVLLDSAPPGAG